MSEQRINEYIEGKYGKFGVDRYAAYCTLTKLIHTCNLCTILICIQSSLLSFSFLPNKLVELFSILFLHYVSFMVIFNL